MRTILFAAAGLLMASTSHGAPLVFGARLDATPAGSEPRVIRAADMDGDGDLDAVVTCSVDTEVTVMLNNGDGSFVDEPFNSGLSSWGMDVGDLDGDGDVDVVVAGGGHNERRIKIFLNRGDATFDAGPTLMGGPFGVGVAVFDADNDGDLDITHVANVSSGVTVFLNDGHGSFVQGPGVLGVFSADGTGVAWGFINGDDLPDMLVSHYNGVTVMLGQGGGAFLQSGGAGVTTTTYSVALGDIDGDGFADAASTVLYGNAVAVRFGNGDGTFGALRSIPLAGSGLVYSAALADLNGDGRAEVLVNGDAFDTVNVFVSGPGRTFQPEQRFAAATQPVVVFAADVNNDGKTDLLAASRNLGDEPVFSSFLNLTDFPSACEGDTNGDGVVNFADLNAVLAVFGQSGDLPADLNGDGVVNFADLNAVLAAFGVACP